MKKKQLKVASANTTKAPITFLDNLSYEATKGMIINAEKGKRNGGVAPYGYTLKEKKRKLP